MANGWDNATLKKLKTLFDKGLSTAEIGRKLGISKNAVVGKINRLGWNAAKKTAAPVKKATAAKTAKKTTAVSAKKTAKPTKTATVKSAATKKTQSNAKPAKTAKNAKVASTRIQPKPAPVVKTASKKTNRDLAVHQRIIQHSLEMANLKPNQCRWPIGDPDSDHFHFCGAQVFTGKPYCYEHCRQAYQFSPLKKK